jgi:hypothetical protein
MSQVLQAALQQIEVEIDSGMTEMGSVVGGDTARVHGH